MSVSKIIHINRLVQIRKQYLQKKIILISGCFDVIHIGHLRFLEEAKKSTDILVVGVLSDHFVRFRKGEKRPIFSEKERANLVAGFETVDVVVIFGYEETELLLENLQPNYYGIGGDRDKGGIKEKALLSKYGVKIKKFSRFGSNSTSSILEILKSFGKRLTD